MPKEISLKSIDDLAEFARSLSTDLAAGDVVELVGDVGAGKTTLVRYLAKNLGFNGAVSSPTFVIENVYVGKIPIRHLDLYRLSDAGIVAHEIKEALDEKDSLLIIEWAGLAEDLLPKKRLKLEIISTGENSRKVICHDTRDQNR